MLGPIVPSQKVATRNIKIAIINKTAIFLDQSRTVDAIPSGDFIPWHHRRGVMGGMKVVIEKKQRWFGKTEHL